ncbi:MAG: response regulator transcription factor, partial [Chloroflexi bacterium]
MQGPTAIRVMIVEDHLIVNEGLAALLNDQPDMIVVGSAGSVAESVPLAELQAPDVVLLDFRLPDG